MPLNLFYTMVQKRQKWPKTPKSRGGPALKSIFGRTVIGLSLSLCLSLSLLKSDLFHNTKQKEK